MEHHGIGELLAPVAIHRKVGDYIEMRYTRSLVCLFGFQLDINVLDAKSDKWYRCGIPIQRVFHYAPTFPLLYMLRHLVLLI